MEAIRYSVRHFLQIKSAQEVLISVVIPHNVATAAEYIEPHQCCWGSLEGARGECTHLEEGFGPDSGAHLQDDTGSSLQEANVTLQLPALHQRARLQEDVRHTLKTRPHMAALA